MEHNLIEYIRHPETLDNDSLFVLRALVEHYPYHQTARLLYLRNLYQLHDPAFGDELRRSAIFVVNRKALFQIVEGTTEETKSDTGSAVAAANGDLTSTLIDGFLSTLPAEKPRRAPLPVDATTDYISYLLQTESTDETPSVTAQPLQGHELIDTFIGRENERIVLSEIPQYTPETETDTAAKKNEDEGYFTETLAKIYIKQGRYAKAIEIIRKLSLNYPKKNRYFADQIRFLEKLIINNNNKKD